MIPAGGLIHLHYHDHMDVLESFTDVDGILYYKASPLFSNVQLSKKAHNHLTKENDGLFVDGTFIDRFSYDQEHDELLFDNIIVSREYPEQEIKDMVNALWTTTPYKSITKVNTITNDIQIDNLDISFENKIRKIKSFDKCTWTEISNFATKYYNGELSLEDIRTSWHVGDSKSITLSDMPSDGFVASQAGGNFEFVIIDHDHDQLSSAINEKTKSLLTLSMRTCLPTITRISHKRGDYDTNFRGWTISELRSWCNSTVKNAFPEPIRSLIKPVVKITEGRPGYGDTNNNWNITTDYIFILTAKEFTNGSSNAGTIYEYYKTITNRNHTQTIWTSSAPEENSWYGLDTNGNIIDLRNGYIANAYVSITFCI